MLIKICGSGVSFVRVLNSTSADEINTLYCDKKLDDASKRIFWSSISPRYLPFFLFLYLNLIISLCILSIKKLDFIKLGFWGFGVLGF